MNKTRTLAVMAVTFALVGCAAQNPISKAQSSCEVIFADADAQRMLAQVSAEATSFCACMMDGLKEMSETDQAHSILALNTVASQYEETGRPIEEIAREFLESDIEDPFSEEQSDLFKGMRLTERLIDKTGNKFEDGGCQGS